MQRMQDENKQAKQAAGRVMIHRNNEGFVLVLTMTILIVLSIIGLSATRLSRVELIVSGNDRIHKETFYAADSGTELGYLLAYENAICSRTGTGFQENYGSAPKVTKIGDNIIVIDKDFAENYDDSADAPSDTKRHIVYYPGADLAGETYSDHDTEPHTNIMVQASTSTNAGFGLQMVSGYEGSVGVGAAKGGTSIDYTVGSRHLGVRNSNSLVKIDWRANVAVLNAATSHDCNY